MGLASRFDLTERRCSILEMPCLDRLGSPVVVSTIGKSYRCRNELGRIDIFESRQLHGNVVASDFFDVAASERAHAAVSAE